MPYFETNWNPWYTVYLPVSTANGSVSKFDLWGPQMLIDLVRQTIPLLFGVADS